jgi:hypothetical protein
MVKAFDALRRRRPIERSPRSAALTAIAREADNQLIT